MAGEKIRLRFRKTGLLRLLSHLDLARCLERMLRRADIPFRSTAGFHPTPRAVFALSLPLGVDGLDEVFELELKEPLEAGDVRERLNRQAPAGLEFTSAVEVPLKATAVPRSVTYTLDIPPDRVHAARAAAERLMASEKVWADRHKPRPRRVNIRPYLRKLSVGTGNAVTGCEVGHPVTAFPVLTMDLWVTQTGTARGDELLHLLGLSDLPAAGHVLARSELAVYDETPPGSGGVGDGVPHSSTDAPPSGPPDTAPLEIAPADAGDDAPAPPTWGLSPNGPVVE